MALTDNQAPTKLAIATAFKVKMEELCELPDGITDEQKEEFRQTWLKMGHACAAGFAAVMQHIVSNAEIGTVTSGVVGDVATQDNTGTGLIK